MEPKEQTTSLKSRVFKFKHFELDDDGCGMKLGSDSVILGALAFMGKGKEAEDIDVLDIGCGSGILSLMIAQRFSNAHVTGVEIDSKAYMASVRNFKNSIWHSRLEALNQDVMDMSDYHKFDMIVSNPPYFLKDEKNACGDASRYLARHHMSLTLSRLADAVDRLLTPEGYFSMIYPMSQAKEAEYVFMLAGFCLESSTSIITKEGKEPGYTVLNFARKQYAAQSRVREILIVKDKAGEFTPSYISLTKDFYLKF